MTVPDEACLASLERQAANDPGTLSSFMAYLSALTAAEDAAKEHADPTALERLAARVREAHFALSQQLQTA